MTVYWCVHPMIHNDGESLALVAGKVMVKTLLGRWALISRYSLYMRYNLRLCFAAHRDTPVSGDCMPRVTEIGAGASALTSRETCGAAKRERLARTTFPALRCAVASFNMASNVGST